MRLAIYARYSSDQQRPESIRGQMVTPADGIEWHVMQDVRRRIKGALSTTEPQGEQPKPDTTEQAGTYTSAQE